MKEKLVTIVVLPYSKAHILKMKLEAEKIECELENIDLIEGTTSFSVKVKILEKDVPEAVPILDDFLGKNPLTVKKQTEKIFTIAFEPKHIAQKIIKVLNEKNTLPCYSVGRDAERLMIDKKRLSPLDFEKAVNKFFEDIMNI